MARLELSDFYNISPAQFKSPRHVVCTFERSLSEEQEMYRITRGKELALTYPLYYDGYHIANYLFSTEDRGDWCLKVMSSSPQTFERGPNNPGDLERFRRSLQNGIPPLHDNLERIHERVSFFLTVNQSRLDRILQSHAPLYASHRSSYQDVPLDTACQGKDSFGRPDIVFIGSDGNIRVIEIGNKDDKSGKLQRYKDGIRAMYRRINGKPIPHGGVQTYIARYVYSHDLEHNLVILHPPRVGDENVILSNLIERENRDNGV